MNNKEKKQFRFKDVLVDEDRRVVVVSGRECDLQPRVFDLLIYLIHNRDRAVSKEEIQDSVWQGMFVSYTVLSRTVMKARRAVGDDARQQSVIKTLHGHGYRFVAELDDSPKTKPAPSDPAKPEAQSRFRPRAAVPVWLLVLLPLLGVLAYLAGSELLEKNPLAPDPHGEEIPVAVLPFTNLSDDKDGEYFSDGLSEEIMGRLARVPGLVVVARTSAFSFKDSNKDSQTIADELQVTHLIDGSVRKESDRLRVNAQLLDRDGFQLWSKSYSSVLGDVFALQDRIANDIVSQVGPSLPVDTRVTPIETVPPTRDLDAYELVLRGNFHLQRRNQGPLNKSIALFEQALSLDRNYADAYVGLATAYALLPSYSYETMEDAYAQAMAIIETGERFDPSVAVKTSALRALMLFNREWRWKESEEGFRNALEISPDNAQVLQWYSLFLGSTGRTSESLRLAQRAQQLDPLSPVVNHRLAIAHLWADHDDEALRYFERARELGMPSASIPGAYIILLLRLGKIEEAEELLVTVQRMLGLDFYWLTPLMDGLTNPEHLHLAIEAVENAERNGDIPRLFSYGIWTYLRQKDRALEEAFELIEDRPNFNTEFLFSRESAVLRDHPKFTTLLEHIGLPVYWQEFGWADKCYPKNGSISCD